MIATQAAGAAVYTVISLAALWVLVFYLYRTYRIDMFRQRMFATRDRLFDYAAGGAIPFDHPAYRLLRTTMNGFIRFGDRLTLFSALLVHIRYGRALAQSGDSFEKRLEEAMRGLSEPTRQHLVYFRNEMNYRVLEQLVLASPLLLILLSPVILLDALKLIGARAMRRFFAHFKSITRWASSLDSLALSFANDTVLSRV